MVFLCAYLTSNAVASPSCSTQALWLRAQGSSCGFLLLSAGRRCALPYGTEWTVVPLALRGMDTASLAPGVTDNTSVNSNALSDIWKVTKVWSADPLGS